MAATGTGSDEGTRPRGGGAARARFDVVALVASAGGLSALNQVLQHLPDDFGAPVVIVQHLGGANSILVDILPDTVTLGQLRLQGGFAASRNAWCWVVGLYSEGILDPAPLITHRFPLREVNGAFTALTAAENGAVKILVHP